MTALARDEDEDDAVGLFRPLDGISKHNSQLTNGVAVSYEYYIQIVPTILELYEYHVRERRVSKESMFSPGCMD